MIFEFVEVSGITLPTSKVHGEGKEVLKMAAYMFQPHKTNYNHHLNRTDVKQKKKSKRSKEI